MEPLNVIQYNGQEIIQRVPERETASIMPGAQLIVGEKQSAVFFIDGKTMDLFGPGNHVITKDNLPLLSNYLKLEGNSPFSSAIYYVDHREYPNKWGSRPFFIVDSEFGNVPIRAFGHYSIKIGTGESVNLFISKFVGPRNLSTGKELESHMKNTIISIFTDSFMEVIGDKGFGAISEYRDAISDRTLENLKKEFAVYGIERVTLIIEMIGTTSEFEQKIKEAMAAKGSAVAQSKPEKSPAVRTGTTCPACHAQLTQGAKFCAGCGKKVPESAGCPNCKAPLAPGAKFCMNCGAKVSVELQCPNCGKKLMPGAKFCAECGTRMG